MHQERSKAASSQEQKAAHATAQLDEAVTERNHLEQKTIAQQAKIENTIQVHVYTSTLYNLYILHFCHEAFPERYIQLYVCATVKVTCLYSS